jgi:putative transposase
MARQARIEYPGALYHVISRGIERRELFRDDADRRKYLALLEQAVVRFRMRLFAFCLMGNQVHLAFETRKIPISRIMRSINTGYAGYFNARHRRTGYLFQGRYKAFVVDRDEYLLSLIRYIHENPVRAGLAKRAGDYRWSSHRLYLGGSPVWLSANEVLERFGRNRSTARRDFVAFFRDVEENPYGEARRFAQAVVGDEGFAQQVFERDEPEDPLIRRIEPENLIRWVAREEKIDVKELSGLGRRREITRVRAICGYLARESARVPLSKIARSLNRDQSTLWRDVKHLEQEMKESRPLRNHVKRIQARFVAWGNTT